jgi:diaminohydroxyphosphoribosylaminopyrimidine deaminase / 5-amino-6-(5-phosphoribosylamino)uracil reductase
LPLSKITQSQAYKVHASETFEHDTLTIYERT